MDRRVVFVDVDGTLVNDRGMVPDSARDAIRQASANGHLVFLCTGRSITQVWSEILDVGRWSRAWAGSSIGWSWAPTRARCGSSSHVPGLGALAHDEIRAELGIAFDVIPSSVAVFGSTSGELSLKGVHKASGIEVVIEHLGIARADTIAIGDGQSDLEMLAHVGLGIAMGNAPQEVRAVADAVTGTPDEDGVRDALSRFGLI